VNELQGEKIDIVSWDEDPRGFIAKALSPSEPVHVELLGAEQTAIVVVPDRQLSLAIGKEGQNTRLAARLTGWRLDIKGMTEWGEIRETILSGSGAEVEPEQVEAAVEVAEELVAEEVVAVAEELIEAAAKAESLPPSEVVATDDDPSSTTNIDEDSILEALIREEEDVATTIEAPPLGTEAGQGLSVDDLDTFILEDMEIPEEDSEENADTAEQQEIGELPVLTPDAGKIRFAEDIVEDFRGGGRRAGRTRRGGGGARRGGGGH